MGKPVNVQAWETMVAQHGCIVTGETAVQIHHVIGRKGKESKFLLGPWYILPLAVRLHDSRSDHPFNVTYWKNRFEHEYGRQKDLFLEMVASLKARHGQIPIPDEAIAVVQAMR